MLIHCPALPMITQLSRSMNLEESPIRIDGRTDKLTAVIGDSAAQTKGLNSP
jgi:hypothetical protein